MTSHFVTLTTFRYFEVASLLRDNGEISLINIVALCFVSSLKFEKRDHVIAASARDFVLQILILLINLNNIVSRGRLSGIYYDQIPNILRGRSCLKRCRKLERYMWGTLKVSGTGHFTKNK